MVTIRRPTAEHVPAMERIMTEAAHDRALGEAPRGAVRDRHDMPGDLHEYVGEMDPTIVVAESEERVVGWAVLTTADPPVGTVFVDPEADVVADTGRTVDPESVRTRLLRELETMAGEAGLDSFRAITY